MAVQVCTFPFNPLIPKSNEHLNSPHNITPESHITVTRIEEMITKETFDYQTDSPRHNFTKPIENSLDNVCI